MGRYETENKENFNFNSYFNSYIQSFYGLNC